MRYVLTIVLLVFSLFSWAQMPVDTSNTTFKYQEVVHIENTSKTGLQERGLAFFIKKLNHDNPSVNKEDLTQHKIKGSYTITSNGFPFSQDFSAQLQLRYKLGRYQYTIKDFKVYTPPSQYNAGGWNDFLPMEEKTEEDFDKKSHYKAYLKMLPVQKQIQSAIDEQIMSIVSELKTTMLATEAPSEDEW